MKPESNKKRRIIMIVLIIVVSLFLFRPDFTRIHSGVWWDLSIAERVIHDMLSERETAPAH